MSSRSKIGSHWKRPATHVYDYNYKIGEHYYTPQLNFAEKRYTGRAGSPPKARTFAERFADDPVYGDYGPPKWRTAATGLGFGYPRRASVGGEDLDLGPRRRPAPATEDDSIFARRRPMQDDDDLGFRRKPFNFDDDLGSAGLRRKPMGEDDFFRRRPFEDEDTRFNAGGDDDIPRRPRPRFDFGEQLLDAVGARGGRARVSPSPFRPGAGENAPRSARILQDPFEEEFFSRRPKPRTADPDSRTEDPFKLRNAKAFGMTDDLDDDFSHDAESVVGRIRSKLRARREREEGLNSTDKFGSTSAANDMNDDFGPSRLDQLRAKTKARMAELDDDFAEFSIKPRRTTGADTLSSLSSKYGGGDLDSGSGSRSIHIKKRTVRTTVDSD